MTTNSSGIHPTENKVLVLPSAVEEKTAGGVFIPTQAQEKDKFAMQEGRLVAVAPLAFNYASKTEWSDSGGEPPKPGQKVLFAKYAGHRRTGKDGVEYLLLSDKEIEATLEE